MYSPDSFSAGSQRSRFADGAIDTASGSQVVVMCFDRLERDLDGALAALEATEHEQTNALLRHAQDLLAEMVAMLDLDAWDNAVALLSVYDYLLRRLAQANTFKDAAAVREARHLIGEIGDGFRGAAAELAATPQATTPHAIAPTAQHSVRPAAAEGFGAGAAERPRLSVRA